MAQELSLDEFLAESASQATGTPVATLNAIRKNEGSTSTSVSPAGAMGKYQFMPATAKQYNLDTRDDVASANAAGKYIADLEKQYKAKYNLTDYDAHRAAVAHYNGGTSEGTLVAQGKQPAKAETLKYMQNFDKQRELSLEDFMAANPEPAASYDETARLAARYPSPTAPITQQSSDAEYLARLKQLKPKAGRSVASMEAARAALPEQQAQGRVMADTAIRGASAGLVQPKLSTPDEIAAHPGSALLGQVVGVAPYTVLTGGASLPIQATVLGARGALQTGMEGGSAGDVIGSGLVEAAAPYAGAAIGKAIKAGGKTMQKAFDATYRNTPAEGVTAKSAQQIANDVINANDVTAAYDAAAGQGSYAIQQAKQLVNDKVNALANKINKIKALQAAEKDPAKQQLLQQNYDKLNSEFQAVNSRARTLSMQASHEAGQNIYGSMQNETPFLKSLAGGTVGALKEGLTQINPAFAGLGALGGYANYDETDPNASLLKNVIVGAGVGNVSKYALAKAIAGLPKTMPGFNAWLVKSLPQSTANEVDFTRYAVNKAYNELEKSGKVYAMPQEEIDAAVAAAEQAAKQKYREAVRLPNHLTAPGTVAKSVRKTPDAAVLMGSDAAFRQKNRKGE